MQKRLPRDILSVSSICSIDANIAIEKQRINSKQKILQSWISKFYIERHNNLLLMFKFLFDHAIHILYVERNMVSWRHCRDKKARCNGAKLHNASFSRVRKAVLACIILLPNFSLRQSCFYGESLLCSHVAIERWKLRLGERELSALIWLELMVIR